MSTEQNKQTVIDFFDQMSNGNVKGFVDLYHEGGAVWTSGNTLISGTQKKSAIQEFAGGIYDAFPEGLKFKINSMTAEDDRVAVEAESEGMHVSGVKYQNFYHFLFILKDSKVLLLKEYMDTEKVTDILCGGQRPVS